MRNCWEASHGRIVSIDEEKMNASLCYMLVSTQGGRGSSIDTLLDCQGLVLICLGLFVFVPRMVA